MRDAWPLLVTALALGCQSLGCQSAPAPTPPAPAARCDALSSAGGRDRLASADAAVRELARGGQAADYLCQRGDRIDLVYLRQDRAVTWSAQPGTEPEIRAIPDEILALVSDRDRVRLEGRRILAEGRPLRPAPAANEATASKPVAQNPAPPRPTAPAPPPAAPAPRADGFDVDALVVQLSRGTGFGAAGLQGWRRVAHSEGSIRATASDGDKAFEVRGDRASVTAVLDTARPHTVSGAALACRRLNEVIFGSDEEAANQATFELLYAVGSESGQQRFDRQVAGRTLSAQRLADGKRVRFSVWPR